MRVVLALAVGFAAVAAPAHAAWYQASSRHFLIYSEQKPGTLRQFAEELEKFDSAVRFVRTHADETTAAAHAAEPHALVNPAPRSHVRMTMCSRETICANVMLARSGHIG